MIVILIGSRAYGGAQKAAYDLYNFYHKHSMPCKLISITDLNPNIKRNGLLNKNPFFIKVRRLYLLLNYINKNQISHVISFGDYVSIYPFLLRFFFRLSFKHVISERTNPEKRPFNYIINKIIDFSYKNCDSLVVQTQSVLKIFKKKYKANIFLVPNMFPKCQNSDYEYKKKFTPLNPTKYQLLFVGRFSYEKNIFSIIDIFVELRLLIPSVSLILYGDGNLRDELHRYTVLNNCSDAVYLIGNDYSKSNIFTSSDLLILNSVYEGFPNVILESFYYHLPVFSSNCNYGPSDIIQNGYNGFLFEQSLSNTHIANNIANFLLNQKLKSYIIKNAYHTLNKYSPEDIGAKWINVIEN